MQRRTLLVLTALTGITFNLSARGAIDFHRHWRIAEAERLFARKDYVAARSEFKELADSAVDSEEHAVLAARAAIALGHQEGEGHYEKAVEEVARIKNQPVADYAHVALLESRGDWAGITNRFSETAIADWPVAQLAGPLGAQDMRVEALLARAAAFTRTGAFQRAERDLEKAVAFCSDFRTRSRALRDLADLRANNLDDAEGAYDANMQIVASGRGGATYFRAVISAATYLSENGRRDEAIALIESSNPREIESAGWRDRLLGELKRVRESGQCGRE